MQTSEKLANLLKADVPTVVLTGAGISAESGVATFRGGDGLWDKFSPQELASVDAFMANPKLVWEWYLFRRNVVTQAKPNAGHLTLAAMERRMTDFTLITQNVDNLHQEAGSERVIELHGNIKRNKCLRCGAPIGEIDIDPDQLPLCSCGGQIRPDVVWFGEMLPEDALQISLNTAAHAQLFFSIGTSAVVYPAADLPITAKRCGAYLVEINPETTPLTRFADEVYQGKSGELLPMIWQGAVNHAS
jgi:NAD-dependent deacetylase